MKRMNECRPGISIWEAKLADWAKLVERGWIQLIRVAAQAIESEGRPLIQEGLARHFGGDTNVIKRPLARARDFGLFDHYSRPKGYWPAYLGADPSWTRSVRTKPR